MGRRAHGRAAPPFLEHGRRVRRVARPPARGAHQTRPARRRGAGDAGARRAARTRPPRGRRPASRRRRVRGPLRRIPGRAVRRSHGADRHAGLRIARLRAGRVHGLRAMPEPAFSVVRYEVAERIATITLDRPDVLNAFDRALKEELLIALKLAGRDPDVRVVIVTGAGRAFSAGQDLKERLPATPEGPTSASAPLDVELRERYNPLVLAIHAMEKPVIAAVNGVAAGAGMSLALACDLRIGADGASFIG